MLLYELLHTILFTLFSHRHDSNSSLLRSIRAVSSHYDTTFSIYMCNKPVFFNKCIVS